jgi:CheY-like chemotaxis protein/HPt (histidine-containing phosphotransfer) domain-containing protein
MQLEEIDFSLYQEVEFIAELLGEQAYQKGLELYTFIDPCLPSILKGDPLRIRQILTNLVSNAIKFTEQGEIVLRINILEQHDQRLLLKFSVTDTGIGIPLEVQKRLFNAFSQADITISRRYGGTGLGLAIAKDLVVLMNGEIGIDSTLGEGSTFWFTAHLNMATAQDHEIDCRFEGQGQSILVVDSQVTSHRLLDYYARHFGMVCDQVSSLSQAAKILGTQPYLVMFISLSVASQSLEILLQLQEWFPKTRVVLMLHPGDQQIWEKQFPEATWKYLPRPIKFHHFQSCLRVCLDPNSLTMAYSLNKKEGEKARSQPEQIEREQLKILIADDAMVNQKVVTNQLKYLGYNDVTCVMNGVEVLQALEKHNYDVILMDCIMPELDGYQTSQMIRQRTNGDKPIIIAMTANALGEERQKCLAVGMNDYLVKPLELVSLEQILHYWATQLSHQSDSLNHPNWDFPKPIASSIVLQELSSQATPLIDLKRLRNLAQGDREWEEEILEAYAQNARAYYQQITEQLAVKDATKLEYYAHQLRGTSLMTAIQKVPELAGQIEEQAQELNLEQLQILIDKLGFLLQDVYQEIKQIVAEVE